MTPDNASPPPALTKLLSAQKARKVLGWNPRYALEDGLKETIQWYQAFFDEQERR